MTLYCAKCGSRSGEGLSFCRKCGAGLEGASVERAVGLPPRKRTRVDLSGTRAGDPDEMTANGIGSVVVGDGFFIIAVILSTTHSAVSSLLWLLLLIPAFYCFGQGLAEVLRAAQLRRRQKQRELRAAPATEQLPPPRASVADFIRSHTSDELLPLPRPPRRTTGEL